ncbi:MAG: hypothetical protein DRN53_00905 [Thermoprotei archaeon]|nr:MAG: hypothetical protein DRN53_00905 [Thermoprotei archaeon]
MKYLAKALRSRYWTPGFDYKKFIVHVLSRIGVRDGDIVVLSEKAISVAEGNIVDESKIKPGILARLIARIWMRYIWGYILGILCRLSWRTIHNLRKYPVELGARHKQLVIEKVGPLASLCFGSEGGIDVTNLPYSYASLPLKDPVKTAEEIRDAIRKYLGKDLTVVIIDSDRCYSWRSFCISPRKTFVKGIKSGGIFAYVLGNALGLRSSPTPVAFSGSIMSLEELLKISRIAEKMRGFGAGRDVWEMARRFGTTIDGVTWSMLMSIPHYPIVLIRRAVD